MRLRLILLPIALCAAFALGRYGFHREADPQPSVKTPIAASTAVTSHASGASATTSTDDQEDDADGIDAIDSYEDLMYSQPDLIDASLAHLRAQTPGKTDLYAIGFAGADEDPAFRNEVDYLPKLLAQRFGAAGRTVELVNSPDTFKTTPLASRTNLYEAIAGVAKKMDLDDDILLLFLTSHGSEDHELYVAMGEMPLDQLEPRDIRDALDAAHVRWRVIVVSACYSGGFIPALRDPDTLVITAARTDRASFGCGTDSQLTWFGKAFLTEALNQTTDFHDAYARASKLIAGWEKRDGQTPSEPQYWAGSDIAKKLDAWRATLPPAAPVAFVPATDAASTPGNSR